MVLSNLLKVTGCRKLLNVGLIHKFPKVQLTTASILQSPRDSPIAASTPKPEDNKGVQKVIYDGTMAPVNRFFLKALLRETYYQTIIFVAAMMFILGGMKLYWTVTAIPLVTILTYIGIWVAHYYKARYLHSDLSDIQKTYMSSDKTCFFVAEAFYDDDAVYQPIFLSEAELKNFDNGGKISGTTKYRAIVGTVALTRDRDLAITAWMRRMAVLKRWQGQGIGSQLIDRVGRFASIKGFAAIELVTTECHDSARSLYEKKGFEVKQFYHKKFFHLSGLAISMCLMHFKTRPYKGSSLDT